MNLSAILVSRNDNYGGNLIERATFCINSMIDTFDEIIYIDWNSPGQSLMFEILPNLLKTGKLKHTQVTPEQAEAMTNYDPNAQKCCEVLARNIGIRRATGDWIISTNIDIIAPKRQILENKIQQLNTNTFYTLSRRSVMIEEILSLGYQNIEKIRNFVYNAHPEERHLLEKTRQGDDYSIINCCGDFQMAAKHIWHEIRGFEEYLIYPLYADTNVQKKVVMHGFNLQAIFDVPFYHIHHPINAGGYGTSNKKGNDGYRAIIAAGKTENKDTWGFSDIDVEWGII